MKNRRRFLRHETSLFVNKRTTSGVFLSRATDLSASGVFLEPILEPSSLPDVMGLEFEIPKSNVVIRAIGKVVRAGPNDGVGVRFTAMSARDWFLLGHYLGARRPKPAHTAQQKVVTRS
ncbi:MAG: PilZ domain-containing protein [Deltaproteobacteria bacterium]|nr:PilZ domain-containing protein [Deltaproteobacteria bacterium]